jgi:hypothetical protein
MIDPANLLDCVRVIVRGWPAPGEEVTREHDTVG